jgi:2-haloacid dehalogenase
VNAIDTVVFDLGEVLIPWDPRRLYRQLFADEGAMERFLAQVCTPEWNGRQDAGRSLAEGTALLVAAFPEHEALIRAYYGRWEEMLGPVNEGSAALLRDLKAAGYRVLALTNWSGETFPRARRLYPVLEAFEGILVSGEEGLAKPDPVIYRLLCERFSVDPARAVFLDDSPANVAGARGIGMHAVQFQDAGQARRALQDLGVAC